MTTQAEAYLRAIHPSLPWWHLSDEDLAHQLDEQDKRSKAARKAAETRRKKQAKK